MEDPDWCASRPDAKSCNGSGNAARARAGADELKAQRAVQWAAPVVRPAASSRAAWAGRRACAPWAGGVAIAGERNLERAVERRAWRSAGEIGAAAHNDPHSAQHRGAPRSHPLALLPQRSIASLRFASAVLEHQPRRLPARVQRTRPLTCAAFPTLKALEQTAPTHGSWGRAVLSCWPTHTLRGGAWLGTHVFRTLVVFVGVGGFVSASARGLATVLRP